MLAACSAQPAPDSPPDLDTGTPSATMSWIHVAHSPGRRPYFADQWGREVQLHGTNVTGVYRNHEEEDNHPGVTPKTQDVAAYTGDCPVNDARWANPPLCQVDAGGGPWSTAAFDSAPPAAGQGCPDRRMPSGAQIAIRLPKQTLSRRHHLHRPDLVALQFTNRNENLSFC